MTTLYSRHSATNVRPGIAGGTTRRVGLWVAQIVVAAMFLMAGGAKFAGAAPMVALFDAIGIGQWFRYVTGSIEVVSAVALLVPSSAAFGALLLIPTMVGAVITHLFIVGGSPLMAVILLLRPQGLFGTTAVIRV